MTDNGSEFRSRQFGETVAALGARQRFIQAGRPQTNGCVERVQGTILEECWKPSFARLAGRLQDLTNDSVKVLEIAEVLRRPFSQDVICKFGLAIILEPARGPRGVLEAVLRAPSGSTPGSH